MAFIETATSLPTVSIITRKRLDKSPILSGFARRAARRVKMRSGPGATELSERLDGLAVGSEEFRRYYKVTADDRRAAEWLLGSVTQQRLLGDPTVSLGSSGEDILAWCDHGDLNIATVDALLELLDSIELPH